MAQYDGSIRINTDIDTKGLEQGERGIKGFINRMTDSFKNLSAVIVTAFAVGKIIQFGKEAIEAASDLEAVESQFSQVFGGLEKKASESLSKIADQAGITEERMKASYTKIAAFAKTTGMNTSDSLELANRAMVAVADSAAFYDRTLEETTESLQSFLKGNYENDAALGLSATETTRNAAANKLYGKSFIELSEAQKQLTLLQMVEDANALSGALGQAARESDTWTNQVGNLNQAWINLKANIGKFFLPVAVQAVKMIVNIINTITALISKLYTAASAIRSFSKLLTGKESKAGTPMDSANQKMITGIGDSYNDAAEGAENLADANDDIAKSAKGAKKALSGQLSSYDKIKSLSKDSGSGAGGTDIDVGGGVAEAIEDIDFGEVEEGENQFERLAKILDLVIEKLRQLRDIFKNGFFDGLGDYKPRFDDLRADLLSIGQILKDIFTDPVVLAAFDKWAQSLAYLLGSIVGSMASIGLTIATNIVGGIEKYLEQNKDRIKSYLVSMFNIWEEVNYLFSDLFQSIAYIFEAFASGQGQQLTANIIGIFSSAFMGVTELASKIFRDLVQIIIKPFVDNKEAFRTALEGFLGVLAEVTGTIKQGIDDTFAKLNEVYDAHFKPFFDSVAQGLSELVGEFMEFWNGKVQPILDQMSADFEKLWKEHIQPLIDDAIELFGKFADLLKMIWEEIVKPFISWIIQNILPVILPIIQGIWDALIKASEGILGIFDFIIEKIGDFIDWLTEHKSVVEDFIIVIGAFFAAWAVTSFASSVAKIVASLITFITTGGLAATASGVLSTALGVLGSVVSFLTNPFNLIVIAIGAVTAALVLLYKHSETFRNFIDGIIENILPVLLPILDSIYDAVVDVFSGIADIISGLIGILKGVIDFIVGVFIGDWEKAFGGIRTIVEGVMNAIEGIINTVLLAIGGTVKIILTSIGGIFETIFKGIASLTEIIFKGIASFITTIFSKIKSIFSGGLSALNTAWRNTWTGMKTTVINIFNGILSAIKGAINSIIGGAEGMANGVIRGINAVIGALNNLHFDIPDWVPVIGGESFGFNISKLNEISIPRLATGAVIPPNKEFLAVLGDQKSGTNIETPLDTMVDAFKQALKEMGGTGTGGGAGKVEIVLQIDRDVVARQLVDLNKQRVKSGGKPLFAQ